MKIIFEVFAVYLLIINIIAFTAYGVDKSKARKGVWRISEKTLVFLAAVGGSVGALFGMSVFHHKTKHLKFKLGVPIILAVQIVILIICRWFFLSQ